MHADPCGDYGGDHEGKEWSVTSNKSIGSDNSAQNRHHVTCSRFSQLSTVKASQDLMSAQFLS